MEFTNLGGDTLLVREGVLYFKKQAIYIIEKIEAENDVVFVYEVHDPNSEYPIKEFKLVETSNELPGGTVIGDTVKRLIPRKAKKKKVDNPPIFIAPIVDGIDTITQVQGEGFFERQPDTLDASTGNIIEGNRSGIFISLKSIEWRKSYVPTSYVINKYNQYKMQKEYLYGNGQL